MSTFSTTVTKAQRNDRDFNSRGEEISICSRQHTKRPGYNQSPYAPKVFPSKPILSGLNRGELTMIVALPKKKKTTVQVRPTTKRGQRSVAPTSKDIQLPVIAAEKFLETTCELATPLPIFLGIYTLSHGKPCIGCSYDVTSKTGCKAKQELLRERGLIK